MSDMIHTLHKLLITKQLSCTELTTLYLDAIKRDNQALNVYVKITAETALKTAKQVDQRLHSGETVPLLYGIPMSLKDNISTAGIETTCCSSILSGYIPPYDATAWSFLRENGAVLLGKTNMDEFAMGSTGETSRFGGARNPHNTHYTAGGSSGGAAGSVAGNLGVYAIGSDTGGSVRQPASFCGAVGLKPTYGVVSRYGLIAYASAFDQVGVIAGCARDVAAVFDAIARFDPMDANSADCGNICCLNALENSIASLAGKKIGVVKEWFAELPDELQTALEQALATYEKMGAEVVRLSLPVLDYAPYVYYILACAQASSNLGRYDGIRYGKSFGQFGTAEMQLAETRSEGFGKEAKQRILLGSYVLSAGSAGKYYEKAQKLRVAICRSLKHALTECDCLLSPTVPSSAFPLGFGQDSQIPAYLSDRCTAPANLAGLPAISIPCGFDKEGLPLGMQLMGKRFSEPLMLSLAHGFEQETDAVFLRHTDWGVTLGI